MPRPYPPGAHAILGLLVLAVAFAAVLAALATPPTAATRYLAVAIVLVIVWAAMPSLGLPH